MAYGLNPIFQSRLNAMLGAAAKAGFSDLGIGSGYRTVQQQIELRQKNGCPDIWSSPASSCRIPTAIPGRSRHNYGLAADLTGSGAAKRWAAANAGNFGLHFNVNGEDWHVEPIDADHLGDKGLPDALAMARFAGSDNNWMDATQDPANEVADRLDSIANMLGGGDYSQSGSLSGLIGTPSMDVVNTPSMNLAQAPIDMTVGTQPDIVVGGGQPAVPGMRGGGIPEPGFVPPGDDPVERWRPVALAALAYTGQDPKYVDLMLRRMRQESGGDPRAVNNWDANAMRGDPSQGLMQNIGSAWNERARELAGRGIFDGFANMVASIRYTLDRYGTLAAWAKKGGY